MSATTTTTIAVDAALSLFRRQYLQLVDPRNVLLPPASILAQSSFQDALYDSIFAPNALPHPPPPRYTFTVLKLLIRTLESAISEVPDSEVNESLLTLYTEYLCTPPPPTPPTTRLPVTYTLPLPLAPLTILESPHLISGALTTGHRTWEAALALCEYLLANPGLLKNTRSLLELGAGTGIVAMLAARMGVPRVRATDGDPGVVEGLRENMGQNNLEGVVTCEKLWWGAERASESEGGEQGVEVDLVLGADVTYDAAAIPDLVSELVARFDANTNVKVVVSATVRNEETFEAFRKGCAGRGLEIREEVWRRPRGGEGEQGREEWVRNGGERMFYELGARVVIVHVTREIL